MYSKSADIWAKAWEKLKCWFKILCRQVIMCKRRTILHSLWTEYGNDILVFHRRSLRKGTVMDSERQRTKEVEKNPFRILYSILIQNSIVREVSHFLGLSAMLWSTDIPNSSIKSDFLFPSVKPSWLKRKF